MAARNYYDTLGVAKDASQEDIKKAFRSLAKKYHPDRNPGDKAAEERFKEVNEAYDTLSDPAKRQKYDQLSQARAAGFTGFEDLFGAGGGRGRRGGGGRGFSFEDLGGFRDLFGSFFDPGEGFARQGGSAAPRRGDDREVRLTVPFDAAVKGGKSNVRLPRQEECPTCSGSGAAPGAKTEPCPQCGGRGTMQFSQGKFLVNRQCPYCGGTGNRATIPCATCQGQGRVEKTRTLTVDIPKGVHEGAKIRLRGQGDRGEGGAPDGDLILKIHIGAHASFQRRGSNILSQVEVSLTEAVLGTTKEIDTYWGKATLRIPAGIAPGSTLRLKGMGVELDNGSKGDHHVTVLVNLPKELTDEQRKLVESLRETGL